MKNDSQNSDFIEMCRNIDFSSESVNKEKNLEILKSKLKDIENERESTMNRKFRKPTALIVAAAALICLSAAVYGQDLIRIIKTVALGSHAEYYVVEDNREPASIPEEIAGKIFDKKGEVLQIYPEDGMLYNEKGERIMLIFDDGENRLVTYEEYEEMQAAKEANFFITRDLQEGKGYFICDTLTPSYLPEGYTFDRIEFYGDPTTQEDIGAEKYMGIYYSNSKYEMYSQVRYMDEETAFGSSATENIQQIKINGYDAVIDKNTLDIQIGDVMYMFFAPEDLNEDDLVKIAESLE